MSALSNLPGLGDGITLAPSTRGVGPNTYLGTKDFWATIGAAILVHIVVLGVYSLWPKSKVNDIPVRALSFKLGGENRIAAYGLQTGVGTTTPSATPVAAPPVAKPVAPKPAPAPVAKQAYDWRADVAANNPVMRQRPLENTVTVKEVPTAQPAPAPVQQPQPQPVMPVVPAPVAKPIPVPAPAAISPTPQRFIREVGTPVPGGTAQGNLGYGIQQGAVGGQGTENVMTPQTAEAIRARYEQEISAWIERHKIYPAEANRAQGRVTMRVRVDRQGYVRYYAIDVSAGNAALDRAAIEMIRRANPVPAAPSNYPAGDLIEFLIPITFEAP